MPQPLAIDPYLPAIVDAVRHRGAAVVVAAPGAGKTTRVAPALAAAGPLILLQPRRVAARALARRIADEQRWTLGEEVGWQVRFERRFSARTRVLVATEGILTARLQSDPLLTGFRTVILDEFHERSLHGDLALALVRQAARARGDLAVVVMSATLGDLADAVAGFLGGAPVVEVSGRSHPVEVAYAPGRSAAEALRDVAGRPGGHVLAFFPGAPEIRRAAEELAGGAFEDRYGVRVLPLHGGMGAEQQDAALAPSERRKVVLATNLAETSLTVDGVTDVVDGGLHKVLRYDPDKGIDRLETERIPQDSADQRAGRAGRTGPGRVLRLWDPRERLRPRRAPEVQRVDLAGPVLDIIGWGGDPLGFEWLEPPPAERVEAALGLLRRLGAVDGRRLTPAGDAMRRLGLHPRLARVLTAAGGSPRAAAACAVLSERLPAMPASESTASDVLTLVDRLERLPGSVRQAARELAAIARQVLGTPGAADDVSLRRALLAGYPDRVARRRAPGSPRLVLASGHGAVLARESGVRDGEFLVALEVAAGAAGPGSEALVRVASRVEREWIVPTGSDVDHRFDEDAARVRAVERTWYDRLVLEERPVPPDPDRAAAILAERLVTLGLDPAAERVRRRLRFAGIEVDLPALVREACRGVTALPEVDLRGSLPHDVRRELERLAPEAVPVPSGRAVRLDYREDGTVAAAIKLQELFGLGETPRVGPCREPVLLELLAPNGRPVQTTRDLRSFWEQTYAQVRKELRGRYPRHPWPEDPWSAPPTARAKRRR